MSYIGNSPGVASQRIVTSFTATSGQTLFTLSSGYSLGYLDVYLNGVKLINGTDYTASNGTTVTLTQAAALNDTVECVAYLPRGLSDGYLKSETDALLAAKAPTASPTFTGNVTLGSSVLATPIGSAPSYTCRAWVNFNGTGTVAIRASGNVSSITDNGTGDYTVNFTNALADANYSMAGSAALTTTSATPRTTAPVGTNGVASGNCQIRVCDDTGAASDCAMVSANFFR